MKLNNSFDIRKPFAVRELLMRWFFHKHFNSPGSSFIFGMHVNISVDFCVFIRYVHGHTVYSRSTFDAEVKT